MVQRKVPSKLGFQAEFKPACFQNQDGKNRGSDMKKKKMKRSKPTKLSSIESFNSTPLKKTISQPEKSPPLCSPATVPTPQKQAMIKSAGGSPNYMKGTTSSEARKERLRKSSDLCKKPAKCLTKSSSLKLVRTLTKTPSFKPVRSGAKKSSRVALCADGDVQKATCSSTLKDSKFPPYLMLNPGGTESEGTSVLKVCSYTYCSLNGHHHTPLPPLKCFLKAKRRSMKTQKSSKLQVSSPRRVKPACDETEQISTELGMDFFVEIYAKKQAENNEDSKSSFHGDDEAAAEEANKDQVSENLSDASPKSEIDSEENFVAGLLSFLSEEARAGGRNNESDIEGENISETSDMEWEEAQVSNSEICEKEYKCCISVEFPSEETKQFDDEPEIIGSDDGVSNCTEEILADDVLQELFYEESASCSLQCHESDSEMEYMVQNWQILEEKSDSMSAATSMEESIVESESNEFEMNPQLEDAGDSNANQKDKSLQFYDAIDLPHRQIADSSESFDCQKFEETEADQSSGLEEISSGTAEDPIEEQEQVPTQEPDKEINYTNVDENQDSLDKDQGANNSEILTSTDSEDLNNSKIRGISSDENENGVENTEVEVKTESDAEQNSHMADKGNSTRSGSRYQRGSNFRPEPEDTCINRKWTIKSRKPIIDSEEEREFNPREPNFLPVVPDPEAEKVDLKHQNMDDRKNAEEWMLDYALQQTVTKLAPARKRKVALLVEAFEKVLPVPKYDTRRIRNTESAFSHSRPIQACS